MEVLKLAGFIGGAWIAGWIYYWILAARSHGAW